MENVEIYWAIVSHSTVIINYLLEGWLIYRYVKPFVKNKPHIVGIAYSVVMLIFFCIPQPITYPNLQGTLTAWIVMCVLEKRNIKQKAFLATTMYLFRWVVYGVTLVLRDFMFDMFLNTEYMLYHPIQQVFAYTIVEMVYYGIAIAVMYWVVKLIHKIYANKKVEITGKELVLLFSEVEKLYGDIRALKHDMGNHVLILEQLFLKNETEELEKYMAELKRALSESVAEIKTGSPVTDVILTQKQKEADEKGIRFDCKFAYPMDTNINAFDISVILNNAIENAFGGVNGCENSFVSISAYRKKNAYMLEVTNCISKHIEIDDETGLPETTKKDKGSHGFGLANIRKVAQKYYGDIDISLEGNKFTLSVMLMVE